MQKMVLTTLVLLGGLTGWSQQKADEILGVWETEDKDGKIEIFSCGSTYCGKLLWGKNIVNPDGTSKKDVNNPDEALRSRDMVGATILTGLAFDGEEYEDGRIYNAEDGDTYKCYIWIEKGVLHLRGYLGIPALGQTTKWSRIK
ncbi:DUF2147 domain-containing protein [bacterium SCSIO 12741]|nr:DUF2147 domain-containing protein [bacterium SCSIO 12741]